MLAVTYVTKRGLDLKNVRRETGLELKRVLLYLETKRRILGQTEINLKGHTNLGTT